jgi:hypothetical protein
MKCQGKATLLESQQVGPDWQWVLQVQRVQQALFLEWLPAPPWQASSSASQMLPA